MSNRSEEALDKLNEGDRHALRIEFYRRVTLLIALPLAFIALIPALTGIVLIYHQGNNLEAEVQARCLDGQVNRNAIRDTLTDNLDLTGYAYDEDTNTLVKTDKKPDPYYEQHPEQLRRAIETMQKALNRFPPITCDG